MTPFQKASTWIDAENAQDPNSEIYQSKTYPKELLYSNRMYERIKVIFQKHETNYVFQ